MSVWRSCEYDDDDDDDVQVKSLMTKTEDLVPRGEMVSCLIGHGADVVTYKTTGSQPPATTTTTFSGGDGGGGST